MDSFTGLEIKTQITDKIPKWDFDGRDLCREFSFGSYLNSIEFVNAIGIVAEAMNHHPVIHISWGKVVVQVHTHSITGIGPLDFELASKLDKFYLLHYDV
jgi:4a-hydroxytetrahydrobiopterin dehydratase